MALTRYAGRTRTATRAVAVATPAAMTPTPTRAVTIREMPRLPPPPSPRPSGIERELAATGGFDLRCAVAGISGNAGSLAATVTLDSPEISAATQSGGGHTISVPLPEAMARALYLHKYIRIRIELDD